MRIIVLATALTAAAWIVAAPAAGEVHVGINIGVPLPPPTVIIAEPPPMVVVPTTPAVQYVPSLPYDVFVYRGAYYSRHHGAWFYGPSYHGPWVVMAPRRVPRPILVVPAAYYRVPPGHWHHDGHGHRGGHGHGHGHDHGHDHGGHGRHGRH